MYPYYMREEPEPRRENLEIVAAAATLGILLACVISNTPRLNLTTSAAQAARAQEQGKQALAELQTQNEAVEAQMAKLARLLESTRSDLTRLTEGQNTLHTQVAATTGRMQQLEAAVQQTTEQMAKFSGSGVLQKITKERDDAVAHAQQREDQVRQLTLKLQKAGVYP
jgi:chromosome segregation ATPase